MNLKVNQFCCFCTLQTGTKLIGFISVVGVVVEIMACISIIFRSQVQSLEDHILQSYIIGIVLTSVMASALTVSTLFLLIAAFKNDKPLFLMPWLVIFAATSVFLVSMLMYIGIFGIRKGPVDMAAATIFGSLFLAGVTYYFCVVVYSYYKQLLKNSKNNDFVTGQIKVVSLVVSTI